MNLPSCNFFYLAVLLFLPYVALDVTHNIIPPEDVFVDNSLLDISGFTAQALANEANDYEDLWKTVDPQTHQAEVAKGLRVLLQNAAYLEGLIYLVKNGRPLKEKQYSYVLIEHMDVEYHVSLEIIATIEKEFLAMIAATAGYVLNKLQGKPNGNEGALLYPTRVTLSVLRRQIEKFERETQCLKIFYPNMHKKPLMFGIAVYRDNVRTFRYRLITTKALIARSPKLSDLMGLDFASQLVRPPRVIFNGFNFPTLFTVRNPFARIPAVYRKKIRESFDTLSVFLIAYNRMRREAIAVLPILYRQGAEAPTPPVYLTENACTNFDKLRYIKRQIDGRLADLKNVEKHVARIFEAINKDLHERAQWYTEKFGVEPIDFEQQEDDNASGVEEQEYREYMNIMTVVKSASIGYLL